MDQLGAILYTLTREPRSSTGRPRTKAGPQLQLKLKPTLVRDWT
jgi:hypothetical protein